MPVLKTGKTPPRRYRPPSSNAGMPVGLAYWPLVFSLTTIYLSVRPDIGAIETWIMGAIILTATVVAVILDQRHFEKVAKEKLIQRLERKSRLS